MSVSPTTFTDITTNPPTETTSYPLPSSTIPPLTTTQSIFTTATMSDTTTPPPMSRPTLCPPTKTCTCRLTSSSCPKRERSSLLKQQDLTMRVVSFISVKNPLGRDMLNSSSTANESSLIKRQLRPIFQRRFSSSFISLEVVSMRENPTIHTVNLQFRSSSVPDDDEIQDALINATSVFVDFKIETKSISVQDKT
ncbi:PREDICTED: mucin-2-like [Cyprinodon variegatus]|uniref:mucin-2-like n=1 Tax=Cyprinodon variegatus TaxID=28743 RepID=UPI00074252FB|nr:PREDICTED: mucin-2-like [Cyprinodon variegatus]